MSEEHKALLSMLVTLERALSNAKLGEEIEALCAEARALITAAAPACGPARRLEE